LRRLRMRGVVLRNPLRAHRAHVFAVGVGPILEDPHQDGDASQGRDDDRDQREPMRVDMLSIVRCRAVLRGAAFDA